MFCYLLFDGYDIGFMIAAVLFVVMFAVLLNPPTRLVRKLWGRIKY